MKQRLQSVFFSNSGNGSQHDKYSRSKRELSQQRRSWEKGAERDRSGQKVEVGKRASVEQSVVTFVQFQNYVFGKPAKVKALLHKSLLPHQHQCTLQTADVLGSFVLVM